MGYVGHRKGDDAMNTATEAKIQKSAKRIIAARKAAETRAYRAKPETKAAVAALLAELMGE